MLAGSSPLTRGKRFGRVRSSRPSGLIPAHAGKTRPARNPRARAWAHPRSRGENAREDTTEIIFKGSSPLTRGKRRSVLDREPVRRLIPAHAGKTQSAAGALRGCRAHPRSRGENDYYPTGATLREGSSPLTRGKLPTTDQNPLTKRLIPAHAGKTLEELVNTWQARAHPRSRGENLGDHGLNRGPDRLIPAHAGKTSGGPPRRARTRAHPRSRGENG